MQLDVNCMIELETDPRPLFFEPILRRWTCDCPRYPF